MYRETLTLGVVPNKRSFLSMVEAKRQKDCFMEEIRKIKASIVEIVDIDDICENGIVCEMDKVNAIVDKMKNRKIDALFFPFCDFGEEQVVAAIASKFTVPILIWGPRDERPNTDEARGRDTQCGMFAATKVLQRYGLKYSLVGVRSIEHADENCKTFDWKLTEEEMKILDSKIEECAL